MILSTKKLNPKKILTPKFLAPKKILTLKNFWITNIFFTPKMIFCPKNFDPKNNFDPKIFLTHKLQVQCQKKSITWQNPSIPELLQSQFGLSTISLVSDSGSMSASG